jgi:hypothetical protein
VQLLHGFVVGVLQTLHVGVLLGQLITEETESSTERKHIRATTPLTFSAAAPLV